MSTCSNARRIAREPSTDPLSVVAHLIDDGDAASRCLFGARFEPDGVEVHLRPIEAHPTDELLGFVAPSDWSCIGVASGAWASTYDDATRPAITGTDRRRVRLVHAVERSGGSISIFRDGAETPSVHRCAGASSEHAGALDDHLRRALAIPTAAPGSPLEYYALCWIDDIFCGAVEGRLHKATWRDLAARHHVQQYASEAGDPALMQWATSHLVRAGELLAEAKPWSAIRDAMIEGAEARGDHVLRGHLQWMDDGIFSRTLLGRFPPIEDLLLDLNVHLEADAYMRLVDTIDAWGLLH